MLKLSSSCSSACASANLIVPLASRSGCKIDNLLIGGPACNSGQLEKGDVILSLDGRQVTDENIHDLLVGNDKPGDSVEIGVQKNRTGKLTHPSKVPFHL
jgi:S1-C subfamily serine protease